MKLLFMVTIIIGIVFGSKEESDLNIYCEDPEVITNFDLDKYLGKWYQLQRYEPTSIESDNCITTNFSMNLDGSIKIDISYLILPNNTISSDVHAVLSFPNESVLTGKLNITLGLTKPAINYWIRTTDYTKYAIVYICIVDIDGYESFQVSQVMSRTPQLSPEVIPIVDNFIDRYLERKKLKPINQDLELCNYDY